MKDSQTALKFSLKSFIFSKRLYIIAFFIPMIILLVSYMIFGIYPAGEKSVLVHDLSIQYINYYENLRDIFWGRRSFFISWSRNLSGEFIGLFAYYLSSPFMLVVMLLPRSMILESVLIMQLLKVGTASVTFCWFLRSSRKTTPFTSLIFAILYSLMAYMIVELIDPMWLDGLVYLPVICRGIEKLCDDRKLLAFIIPLALMFMANFYIGWMIAIFCCLYFLGYYFFISESTCPFRFKHLLVSGAKFAGGGILAGVCSAWLLIPTYYSLQLGKFGFSEADYSLKTQFDFIDFFMNLFPDSYDTFLPGGSPMVYCGAIVMLLIPLYFLNSEIKVRNKFGYGLLALAILLSMYISPVDMVWHGFQTPNGMPYRYSFIFSFLLLVMAAQAFERLKGITYKELGYVLFLILAYVFWEDSQNPAIATVYVRGHIIEKLDTFATVWFTAVMSSMYALLLYFSKKNYKVKLLSAVLSVLIIGELTVNSVYTINGIDRQSGYSDHDLYNRHVTLGRSTVNKIYEMDSGAYRIEKDFFHRSCDAMAFGTFGISHSSSTFNAAPIEFLRNLGFSYSTGTHSMYWGATYISDAVLGIKYVMENGDAPQNPEEEGIIPENAESKHYDKLVLANGDSEEIMYVYENPYALPVGFMADSSIKNLSFNLYENAWENPFDNQNRLLSALLSNGNQEFFKKIEIDDIITHNAEYTLSGAYNMYTPEIEDEDFSVEYIITAPTDDIIYMFFPSSRAYQREIELFLNNNEFLGSYNTGVNTVIKTLGKFSPGEKFSITANNADVRNEIYFKENYFYYLDEEKFREAIDELKRQPLEIESFKEDHIKGTVTAEKDRILFTSISWEPGWTIWVDGEKTEPVELVDALIGIPVTEGTHTIEMKLFPKGMALGIVLSVLGIAAVVIIGVFERKKRTEASV